MMLRSSHQQIQIPRSGVSEVGYYSEPLSGGLTAPLCPWVCLFALIGFYGDASPRADRARLHARKRRPWDRAQGRLSSSAIMLDASVATRKERLRKIVRSLGAEPPPPPLPPSGYERAAIVATVRGVRPSSVAAWCSYHLTIGFVRIFLYFDDPEECRHAPSDERVRCIAVDDALAAGWSRLGPPAAEWLPFAASEVQARQALNALHALSACVADGSIAWLVHLDADELFYTPSLDCRAHFRLLGERGVHALTYANLEAAPERDHEPCGSTPSIAIPWSHVTLFKHSPRRIPDSPEARAAVDWWRGRAGGAHAPAAAHSPAAAHFLYYSNGKSAVRVSARARPLSVHEWIPGSAAGLGCWYSCLGEADLVQAWPMPADAAAGTEHANAAVLHYACCSSHALWRRDCGGASRYRLRGTLSAPPIYVQTAIASGAALPADGIPEEEGELMEWEEGEEGEEEEECGGCEADEEEDAEARRRVQELFERQVLLEDATEAARQVAAGVCVRVALPATLFGE
jgi:hypothetical protein